MTKIFAFFLPQFHADPHNDIWWGEGFTEWTNVKKARPQFYSHNQPRIPLKGYQMLENAHDIDMQFCEAKSAGVDGFVFYHYWSMGQRLLKKPLDILLKCPDIAKGMEFSLCWANHSWTRSWQNRKGATDVLFEQDYENSPDERSKHLDFLTDVFRDLRYSRIDGKPLFFIYKPEDIPDLPAFLEELNMASRRKLGVDCHICAVVTAYQRSYDYLHLCSSCLITQPAMANNAPLHVFDVHNWIKTHLRHPKSLLWFLPKPLARLSYGVADRLRPGLVTRNYDQTWHKILKQAETILKDQNRRVYFAGFVDFDNTARYGNRARVFIGFAPEKFSKFMRALYDKVHASKHNEFLVINAWNEWAEGMYLQPDTVYGEACLEAVRSLKAKR